MSYLNTLDWFKEYERYDEKTKTILMLLSERQYKFRNLETLHSTTGLEPYILDSIIKNLEVRGVVYIRRHKTTNKIIVGLCERQDTLPTAMLVYTINGVIKDSFVIEYTKKDTDSLFYKYIKKNLLPKISNDEINEIMKAGYYKWQEDDTEHIINITNTKIIPI